MSDGKEDGWRINTGKVDQRGSRCGMGDVEGEDDSGRCWPRAVDVL